MKGNPKQSILDINAVKSVYVESCYEIFMSSYKNGIIMMILPTYTTYPLMKCVSFLNEISIWHSAWRIDNQYVTQNDLR